MARVQAPSSRRHTGRRHCAYCGVALTPVSVLPGRRRGDDMRTWDHVVPVSVGGRLQLPCCAWCNSKKAAYSVSDWLASRALEMRRGMVAQRDPSADPMHPRVVLAVRDEDLHRIRRDLEYHSR